MRERRVSAKDVLGPPALALLGLLIGLGMLEIGLRATGWLWLRLRAPVGAATVSHAGTIRILCLGESTTFDMEVLGRASYPAQLERLLNARAAGRRYVVVNGGVPATTSDRIVMSLEEKLATYRPDIVVTMMGINDGPPDDPLFPVGQSMRILKLARLGVALLMGGLRPKQATPYGPVVAVPRVDGKVPSYGPHHELVELLFASHDLLALRLEDAERRLLPLADRAPRDRGERFATRSAVGQLVLLNLQRARHEEAARYWQRHRDLVGLDRNPRTSMNYLTLQRTLEARGIPLIAVQYPARDLEPLRALLGQAVNVTLVDNESTFLRAAAQRPLGDVYRDLFAGIFGHLTPAGNRLLARNVAAAIERVVDPP